MNLFARTTKNISAENIATARAWIRHVIAPVPCLGAASQFMILLRYNALQRLRSLSIKPHRQGAYIFSTLNIPTHKRNPLPEELSSLLRHLGLRVDQLQMTLLYDASVREHLLQMKCLTLLVYPYLRILSAHKNREFWESENMEWPAMCVYSWRLCFTGSRDQRAYHEIYLVPLGVYDCSTKCTT